MSTADRPDTNAPAASDVAGRLREADFVRLVAGATGDGTAAASLLIRTLTTLDVPYQVSVTPLPEPASRETEADLTIALGRPVVGADVALGTADNHATHASASVAAECGVDDIALTLAGIAASGNVPDEKLLSIARERGIEREPGIAIPTGDYADGLAHSLLVHCALSGDPDTASAALDDLGLPDQLDDDAKRSVASLVALTVAEDQQASTRAATCVERFLRPLAGGPFETIGGYADVLEAVSREQPSLGVALGLGRADRDDVLSIWRSHATETHGAIRAANTGRYDGLFVARCPDTPPVGTVARLLSEYRSPEPLTLVVADGIAVARAVDSDTAVGEAMQTAATQVDGRGAGTETRGRATFTADPTEFVLAFREVL